MRTRKLHSWVKGLLRRNLTATTLISANGTGMELPWLLTPEVVCQIRAQVSWTQVSSTLGHEMPLLGGLDLPPDLPLDLPELSEWESINRNFKSAF